MGHTYRQSLWLRTGALITCAIFIWTNVLFAQKANPSFWEERQIKARSQKSEVRSQNNGKDSELLARLPTLQTQLPLLPHSEIATSPLAIRNDNNNTNAITLKHNNSITPLLSSIAPFAEIKEIYSTSLAPVGNGLKPFPTVVIIQDVHQHYEAQKNIANIIKEMVNRGWKIENRERQTNNISPLSSTIYPLVVGVEGAIGPFDFSPYRAYSDKQLTKDIADFFMQQGMIGGPEFFGITSPDDSQVQMVGVEDEKLYLANIQAFKDSLPLEQQVKVEIKKQETKVKKEKLFNPELLGLDRKREAYHEGNLSLGEYLAFLKNTITTLDVVAQFTGGEALSSFRIGRRSTTPDKSGNYKQHNAITQKRYNAMNVSCLVEAYQIEKSLDISKLESERSHILSILTEKLPKPTLDELLNSALAYRTGNITYAQFYAYFKETSKSAGINFAQFPEMDKYVRYVQLADNIDKNKLFSEIEQLENHIENKLVKTGEEKELLTQSKYLGLVKKLVDFSLTPEEWRSYVSLRNNVVAQSPIKTFGDKLIGHRLKHNTTTAPDESGNYNDTTNAITPLPLKSFEQFYETALKRNSVLVENLLGQVESETDNGRVRQVKSTTDKDRNREQHNSNSFSTSTFTCPLSVLIAGGFHTNGITHILKQKNIPYVVLTPNITKAEKGQKSLEIIARAKTPLEELFTGEKIFLSNPRYFGATNKIQGYLSAWKATLLQFALREVEGSNNKKLAIEITNKYFPDFRILSAKVKDYVIFRATSILVKISGRNKLTSFLLTRIKNPDKRNVVENTSKFKQVTANLIEVAGDIRTTETNDSNLVSVWMEHKPILPAIFAGTAITLIQKAFELSSTQLFIALAISFPIALLANKGFSLLFPNISQQLKFQSPFELLWTITPDGKSTFQGTKYRLPLVSMAKRHGEQSLTTVEATANYSQGTIARIQNAAPGQIQIIGELGELIVLLSLQYQPDTVGKPNEVSPNGEVIYRADVVRALRDTLATLASATTRGIPLAFRVIHSIVTNTARDFSSPNWRQLWDLKQEMDKVVAEQKHVEFQRQTLQKAIQLFNQFPDEELNVTLENLLNKVKDKLDFEFKYLSTLDPRLAYFFNEIPDFRVQIVLNASTPVHLDAKQKVLQMDLLTLLELGKTMPHTKQGFISGEQYWKGMIQLAISRYMGERLIEETGAVPDIVSPTEFEKRLLADIMGILFQGAEINQSVPKDKSNKHEPLIHFWSRDSVLGYLNYTGGKEFSLLLRQLSNLSKGDKPSTELMVERIAAFLTRHYGFNKSKLPSLARLQELVHSYYDQNKMNSIGARMGTSLEKPFAMDDVDTSSQRPEPPEVPVTRPVTPPPTTVVTRSELTEIEREYDYTIPTVAPSFGIPSEPVESESGTGTAGTATRGGDFSRESPRVEFHIPRHGEDYYLALLEDEMKDFATVIGEREQMAFFLGRILPKYFLARTDQSITRPTSHPQSLRFRVNEILRNITHDRNDEVTVFAGLIHQLMSDRLSDTQFREIARSLRNSPYLGNLDLFLGLDMVKVKRGWTTTEVLYGMAHEIDRPSTIFTVFNQPIRGRQLPIHYLGQRLDRLDRDLSAYGFTYLGDIFGAVVKSEARRFVAKNIMPILIGLPFVHRDRERHQLSEAIAQMYRLDFQGQTQSEIDTRTMEITALHELQHTVDELLSQHKIRGADTETSAYLAGIALSRSPFTALVKTILTYTDPFAPLFARANYLGAVTVVREFYRELGIPWNRRANRLDQSYTLLQALLAPDLNAEQLQTMARRIHRRLFGPGALTQLTEEEIPAEVEITGPTESVTGNGRGITDHPSQTVAEPTQQTEEEPSVSIFQFIKEIALPAALVLLIGLYSLFGHKPDFSWFLDKLTWPKSIIEEIFRPEEPISSEPVKPTEPPLPEVPETVPSSQEDIIIMTSPGNTLTMIIDTFYNNASREVARLLGEYNGISDLDTILPWQRLSLPPELKHVIQEGENFGTIADKYYVSIKNLKRMNSFFVMTDISQIYPGDKIVVAERTSKSPGELGILRSILPLIFPISLIAGTILGAAFIGDPNILGNMAETGGWKEFLGISILWGLFSLSTMVFSMMMAHYGGSKGTGGGKLPKSKAGSNNIDELKERARKNNYVAYVRRLARMLSGNTPLEMVSLWEEEAIKNKLLEDQRFFEDLRIYGHMFEKIKSIAPLWAALTINASTKVENELNPGTGRRKRNTYALLRAYDLFWWLPEVTKPIDKEIIEPGLPKIKEFLESTEIVYGLNKDFKEYWNFTKKPRNLSLRDELSQKIFMLTIFMRLSLHNTAILDLVLSHIYKLPVGRPASQIEPFSENHLQEGLIELFDSFLRELDKDERDQFMKKVLLKRLQELLAKANEKTITSDEVAIMRAIVVVFTRRASVLPNRLENFILDGDNENLIQPYPYPEEVKLTAQYLAEQLNNKRIFVSEESLNRIKENAEEQIARHRTELQGREPIVLEFDDDTEINGGIMTWVKDMRYPHLSLEEYARRKASLVENSGALVLGGILIGLPIYILSGDFNLALRWGYISSWAFFRLGHARFTARLSGSRAPPRKPATLISLINVALVFLPIPDPYLTAVAVPLSYLSHYFVNRTLIELEKKALRQKLVEFWDDIKPQLDSLTNLLSDEHHDVKSVESILNNIHTITDKYRQFKPNLASPHNLLPEPIKSDIFDQIGNGVQSLYTLTYYEGNTPEETTEKIMNRLSDKDYKASLLDEIDIIETTIKKYAHLPNSSKHNSQKHQPSNSLVTETKANDIAGQAVTLLNQDNEHYGEELTEMELAITHNHLNNGRVLLSGSEGIFNHFNKQDMLAEIEIKLLPKFADNPTIKFPIPPAIFHIPKEHLKEMTEAGWERDDIIGLLQKTFEEDYMTPYLLSEEIPPRLSKEHIENITKHPIFFAITDASPHLMEDHVANHRIFMNRALLELKKKAAANNDQELHAIADALFVSALSHELMHEIAGRGDREFEKILSAIDLRILANLLKNKRIRPKTFQEHVSPILNHYLVSTMLRELVLKLLPDAVENFLYSYRLNEGVLTELTVEGELHKLTPASQGNFIKKAINILFKKGKGFTAEQKPKKLSELSKDEAFNLNWTVKKAQSIYNSIRASFKTLEEPIDVIGLFDPPYYAKGFDSIQPTLERITKIAKEQGRPVILILENNRNPSYIQQELDEGGKRDNILRAAMSGQTSKFTPKFHKYNDAITKSIQRRQVITETSDTRHNDYFQKLQDFIKKHHEVKIAWEEPSEEGWIAAVLGHIQYYYANKALDRPDYDIDNYINYLDERTKLIKTEWKLRNEAITTQQLPQLVPQLKPGKPRKGVPKPIVVILRHPVQHKMLDNLDPNQYRTFEALTYGLIPEIYRPLDWVAYQRMVKEPPEWTLGYTEKAYLQTQWEFENAIGATGLAEEAIEDITDFEVQVRPHMFNKIDRISRYTLYRRTPPVFPYIKKMDLPGTSRNPGYTFLSAIFLLLITTFAGIIGLNNDVTGWLLNGLPTITTNFATPVHGANLLFGTSNSTLKELFNFWLTGSILWSLWLAGSFIFGLAAQTTKSVLIVNTNVKKLITDADKKIAAKSGKNQGTPVAQNVRKKILKEIEREMHRKEIRGIEDKLPPFKINLTETFDPNIMRQIEEHGNEELKNLLSAYNWIEFIRLFNPEQPRDIIQTNSIVDQETLSRLLPYLTHEQLIWAMNAIDELHEQEKNWIPAKRHAGMTTKHSNVLNIGEILFRMQGAANVAAKHNPRTRIQKNWITAKRHAGMTNEKEAGMTNDRNFKKTMAAFQGLISVIAPETSINSKEKKSLKKAMKSGERFIKQLTRATPANVMDSATGKATDFRIYGFDVSKLDENSFTLDMMAEFIKSGKINGAIALVTAQPGIDTKIIKKYIKDELANRGINDDNAVEEMLAKVHFGKITVTGSEMAGYDLAGPLFNIDSTNLYKRIRDKAKKMGLSGDDNLPVDMFTETPLNFDLSWRKNIGIRIMAIISPVQAVEVERQAEGALERIRQALKQA